VSTRVIAGLEPQQLAIGTSDGPCGADCRFGTQRTSNCFEDAVTPGSAISAASLGLEVVERDVDSASSLSQLLLVGEKLSFRCTRRGLYCRLFWLEVLNADAAAEVCVEQPWASRRMTIECASGVP